MTEKKTRMVLKVDLQCPCCYKKIQKILCRIPQITDRVFDEKANLVMITVKCCNPEKIRDKLCCKGGKIIQSIEIVKPPPPTKEADKPKEAPKPKEAEKPKEAPKPKEAEKKPKEAEKPKEAPKPKEAEKPKEAPKPKEAEKPKEAPKPKEADKPKDASKPGPPVVLLPVQPTNPCCGPCYEGHVGGPCYYGYGFPPPPPQPCYDGHYGPGYVYGRPFYVTRCDYFSEENSTGCTIM